MINKWILDNFKSINREKTLPFRKLTIFTGANSSGKSTILQSILLVSQTLRVRGTGTLVQKRIREPSLIPVEFDKAYQQLGVKEELFQSLYSFFSLHGHPSYLSVCQFRDAFKPEFRADWMMAQHATQCALSFMSIFIVVYMELNPEVKSMYDRMEEPRRFAIGMYEDAMRGEHKFK